MSQKGNPHLPKTEYKPASQSLGAFIDAQRVPVSLIYFFDNLGFHRRV
jgi:hypothetical protein